MSSYINRSNSYNVDTREKIIAMWSTGHLQKDIANTLHLPHQRVSTMIDRFVRFGTTLPGKPGWKERSVSTPQVVEFIEYCKISKPSIRSSEIQEQLIENDLCTAENVPARSTSVTF